MAQRIALGFLLEKILKEVTTNVNAEHKSKIAQDVDHKLITLFGSDWSRLPVTGPRMMAMILVSNIALLPFGIVPATLIEVAIAKSKEYNVEDKFLEIFQSAKLTGDGSKEKIAEFIDYAGAAGKNVKEKLSSLTGEGGTAFGKLFNKSKQVFGKLSAKTKKNED